MKMEQNKSNMLAKISNLLKEIQQEKKLSQQERRRIIIPDEVEGVLLSGGDFVSKETYNEIKRFCEQNNIKDFKRFLRLYLDENKP